MGWGDGKSRAMRREDKAFKKINKRVKKDPTGALNRYTRDVKRADNLEKAGCAVTALVTGVALASAIATWRGLA